MSKTHECPYCKNQIPEPVSGDEVDIRGIAAYWLAELHKQTKQLADSEESTEPAVQEQIRRNVETLRDLISLW